MLVRAAAKQRPGGPLDSTFQPRDMHGTSVHVEPSIAQREALLLAPYAMHSVQTRGRRHAEPPHPYRGPFQRDRDRIVHSSAFRRLGYKMQVFTGEMGDYHRTRLTHTQEVATIARTLARALRLNEDLVEALALAHDVGHPPFGHAGEDALNECLRDHGGFCHNRHALVLLEEIEQRYPGFPGLNLSLEVLEGQAARAGKNAPRPATLLEVQVVDAADAIAYHAHDADDALELKLLRMGDLMEVPLWREARRRVERQFVALDEQQLGRAIVHELIDWMVTDVWECSQRRLKELLDAGRARDAAAVRSAGMVVAGSSAMAQQRRELEQFLHHRVYRHPTLLQSRQRGKEMLRELFDRLVQRPDLLPEPFRTRAALGGAPRATGEYLACLTDRGAREAHRQGLIPRS